MDQTKQEEDYGYGHFTERKAGGGQKTSIAGRLFTFNHKCQFMLQVAMESSPYAKLLLSAMKNSGCKVLKDRHISCEDCDGTVSGGFDAASSQIVLCQNNIKQQAHMNRVVTHELIHAFDHCRAHVDWFNNFRHLACSEECVRGRALRSILAVRKISLEEAQKIVDEVFDSCFSDHAPFGRIPHSKRDANFAYRAYMNRNRYFANL